MIDTNGRKPRNADGPFTEIRKRRARTRKEVSTAQAWVDGELRFINVFKGENALG